MAMSRRFFNNLATQLRELKPIPKDFDLGCEFSAATQLWARSVVTVAAAIKEEAPSFDRDRFLMAADVHPVSAAGE